MFSFAYAIMPHFKRIFSSYELIPYCSFHLRTTHRTGAICLCCRLVSFICDGHWPVVLFHHAIKSNRVRTSNFISHRMDFSFVHAGYLAAAHGRSSIIRYSCLGLVVLLDVTSQQVKTVYDARVCFCYERWCTHCTTVVIVATSVPFVVKRPLSYF